MSEQQQKENEIPIGISYREWLIGQALSGILMNRIVTSEVAAKQAIENADAVIKRLLAEEYAKVSE